MPEMKKLVFKVDTNDQKDKQRVLKAVSSLSGINSLSMDMKERKLTVVGDVDPVQVVSKLKKKNFHPDIVTVGPAKEAEKKKDDNKKKEEDKKKTENEMMQELWKNYKAYYNQYQPQYPNVVHHRAVHHSIEEDPNSCVIC